MISHRHRCIYVMVPKCASTSVRDWFVAHAGGRHSFHPSWYPGPLPYRIQPVARALGALSRLLHLHPAAQPLPPLRVPLPPRNPPRRATRCLDSRSSRALRTHARIRPALRRAPRRREEDSGAGRHGRFMTAMRTGATGRSGSRLRHLRFVATHALPQVDFLPDCNPERLFGVARARPRPLSLIGAVETLDSDFRRVQDALGLPRPPLPRHNASASAPAAFEDLRRNAATRRLIEELYADDLALTGCGLDDAPAPPRRSPDARALRAGPASHRPRLSSGAGAWPSPRSRSASKSASGAPRPCAASSPRSRGCGADLPEMRRR